jgi:hypothetical protein
MLRGVVLPRSRAVARQRPPEASWQSTADDRQRRGVFSDSRGRKGWPPASLVAMPRGLVFGKRPAFPLPVVVGPAACRSGEGAGQVSPNAPSSQKNAEKAGKSPRRKALRR